MNIQAQIEHFSQSKFTSDQINEFYRKYLELAEGSIVLDYLINLSTDEGNELEMSFYTDHFICDITLSKGKIYFYKFNISMISKIVITEDVSKYTLCIYGEKKFDYNIEKPNSKQPLINYMQSLQKSGKEKSLFKIR